MDHSSALFFDRHPRFTETSQTGSTALRLNRRHTAIIEWNATLFPGARVLDIASHDGRWSAAALDAGAQHVLAIEARSHLVANANETFGHYGVPQARYELRTADIFTELRNNCPRVDVVLLLGFFYHVSNHTELVSLVAETGAAHVVVDTNIVAEKDVSARWPSIIALRPEELEHEWNRYTPEVEGSKTAPVGVPSRGAVRQLFEHFGFVAEEYDWKADLEANGSPTDLYDYIADERATFRMTRA